MKAFSLSTRSVRRQGLRMLQKAKKGFTLIELMIVIGILSILAVIAIPQYSSYVARAQAAEALQLLGGAKVAVAEFRATNGRYPDTKELQKIYVPAKNEGRNKYVLEITREDTLPAGHEYAIKATFKTQGAGVDIASVLSNKKLVYATQNGSEGSVWKCFNPDPIVEDNIPNVCRN